MRRVAEIIMVVLVMAGCVQQPQMLEHAPTATHVSQATTTVQPSAAAVSGHPTKIPTPTPTPEPTPEPTVTPTEEPRPTATPEPPTPTPEPTATKEAERESESRYRQVEDGKYVYITESGEELAVPEIPFTMQVYNQEHSAVVYHVLQGNPWGLSLTNPEQRVAGVFYPESYVVKGSLESAERLPLLGFRAEVIRYCLQQADSLQNVVTPLPFDPTLAKGIQKVLLQESWGGVDRLFMKVPVNSWLVIPLEKSVNEPVTYNVVPQKRDSTIKIGIPAIFHTEGGFVLNLRYAQKVPKLKEGSLPLGDRFLKVLAPSFSDSSLGFYKDKRTPPPIGEPNLEMYGKSMFENGEGQFPSHAFTLENLLRVGGQCVFVIANHNSLLGSW